MKHKRSWSYEVSLSDGCECGMTGRDDSKRKLADHKLEEKEGSALAVSIYAALAAIRYEGNNN